MKILGRWLAPGLVPLPVLLPACLWFAIGLEPRAHSQIAVSWTNLHPVSSWYSYANTTTGDRQAGQFYVNASGKYHAALWSGTVGSLVDLHPAGADSSRVSASDATQQVGYASMGGKNHAACWSGSAASFVDLTPAWANNSEAFGVFNSQQVGWCSLTNPSSGAHAVLWSGSAGSAVDLHPSGWKSSCAYATSGSQQVGYVEKYSSGNQYAALWSGSAASFVELGPEWWSSTTVIWSSAGAIGGTNQAGFYQLYNEFVSKAALWSGSPGSFVSLHPIGATASAVWATTDTLQAGLATINGQQCLGVWRGTAQSFVNLGPLAAGLGTGLTNLSVRGMSIQRNTIHLVGSVNSQAVALRIQLLPPNLYLAGVQSIGATQVVTLNWTNNAVLSILESRGALGSAWGVASGLLATNANWYSATTTNLDPVRFFRLRGL